MVVTILILQLFSRNLPMLDYVIDYGSRSFASYLCGLL